jgi:hypothetical protein
MNLVLTTRQIRSVCAELIAERGSVSGRALQLELRARFGAVGKATRVLKIWREVCSQRTAGVAAPILPERSVPEELSALRRRVEIAEAGAAENLARAERAELREQAHQDHWAIEIDRLRQALAVQVSHDAEIRTLRAQVTRLTAELSARRGRT